jgi:predicted GNAT family N-acyltransferase
LCCVNQELKTYAKHGFSSYTSHIQRLRAKTMTMRIRIATSDRDRFRCYRLRYETYVEEMQRPQSFADHEQRITKEPYDDHSHLLMAEDDGELVSTMRMSMLREGPLECGDMYRLESFGKYYPDNIGMITKFVIKPAYRRSGIAGRMAMVAYRFGRDNNISICIIDAYPHLVQLYHQMGYRFYMENIAHPEYGSVIPMVLLLEDVQYFKKIRSPFYRIANKYENDTSIARFFAETFPEYAAVHPLFVLEPGALLDRLSQEIARTPRERFGFLAGFSKEEAESLLSHLAIISYRSGEYVFQQNDESLGMFCIYSGQVEVIHESRGKRKTVAILNEGDIFGELGFLAKTRRTASIRVREPTKLLVLAPIDLEKLVIGSPELGVRFLMNLFNIVVERFITVLG